MVSDTTKSVAVVGSTGGVGRLVVAACLNLGLNVKAVVRSEGKAAELLPKDVEIVKADLIDTNYGVGLRNALLGADAVVFATGTSAFPSDKWGVNGANAPKYVDDLGIKNAVKVIESINADPDVKHIQRVTLLSSVGVQRRTKFPFFILNLFGVLDSKAAGEEALKQGAKAAGYQFAIVRPGRLVGGPYTNPDFATLLKLEEGDKGSADVRLGDPDGFAGDASRRLTSLALAQTLVQALPEGGLDFSLVNKKGPSPSQAEWDASFRRLARPDQVLRLEFKSVDEGKLRRWLADWGAGILTSGDLFPPLPLPCRVDPAQGGLALTFLSVTVTGDVTPLGALVVSVEPAAAGRPAALVAARDPPRATPLPGEGQLLDKLQQDLFRVTQAA